MSNSPNIKRQQYQESVQDLENQSFDPNHKVLVRGIVAENPSGGLDLLETDADGALKVAGGGASTDPENPNYNRIVAQYLYSDTQATLANGAEIDSGWLDTEQVDKLQVELLADDTGMTLVIESSSEAAGTGTTVTTTNTISSTFHLFNVLPRQRYYRARWQNNTGSGTTNASASIKATYGSSDKLSVFPLNTDPSAFSQAALVQAVSRALNPNGEYVNTAAAGKDTGNSSTDNLAISGTYSGAYQDVRGQQSAVILVLSDVQLDDVKLQWSSDGTTANTTLLGQSNFTGSEQVTSGFYIYLEIVNLMIDNYVKVEATNGTTATTVFEIDTWFSPQNYGGSYLPPTAPFTSLTSGLATRSLIVGQQPDGDYVNAPADGGAFETSDALIANDTFTSVVTDTDGHKSIEIYVTTDQVSASDGIEIEYTPDTQAASPTYYPGVKRTFTTQDVTNGFKIIRASTALDGFRVVYTNGGTGQGSFFMAANLKTTTAEQAQDSVKADIGYGNLGTNAKAVVHGDNGVSMVPIGANADDELKVVHEKEIEVAGFDSVSSGGSVSISSTATQFGATPPANAYAIMIQGDPSNNKVIAIGTTTSVSTGNKMYAVTAGGSVTYPVDGAGNSFYGIVSSGTETLNLTWLVRA